MPWRFLHGVASGDPLPDAIVLWTRVTPNGTSAARALVVRWQIWEGDLERSDGLEAPLLQHDFTVKVDVHSRLFRPGVAYTYSFTSDGATSPWGTFRLPPKRGVALKHLDYAIFSCANRGFGNFAAYSEAVDRVAGGLDFWLHLGDFIYEYGQQKYPSPAKTRVPGLEPAHDLVSLADYRLRHAFYRLDPELQRLSAAAPMISIWDDHEVANDDWMHGAENHHEAQQGAYEARKRAAIQAYHEWLPTRPDVDVDSNRSAVPWMRWRRFDFGDLATLLMLETRLVGRTTQAEMTWASVHEDIRKILDGFLGISPYAWPGGEIEFEISKIRKKVEEHRTKKDKYMLGKEQLTWIEEQVASTSKWLLLGQAQVVQELLPPNFFQAILDQQKKDAKIAQYWKTLLHNLTKLGFVYHDFQAKKNFTTTPEMRNDFLVDLAAGRFGVQINFDGWTGYVAERERLIHLLSSTPASASAVVYGGDSHNAWAGHLKHSDGRAVAVDFDGMAVTSPGMEGIRPFVPPEFEAAAWYAANPDLVWADTSKRGFMLVHLSHQTQHLEYIAVDVATPSRGLATSECLAAFDVQHGEVKIQPSACSRRPKLADVAALEPQAMVPIWSLLVACCLGTLLGGCFCRLKQRWSGTKRSYEHCEAAEVPPCNLGATELR
ncbi:Phospholipase D (PLD) [Cleaved into: Phospholipase D catalytic chain [Durusdinium trenchii]|uniref:Phospholipase D (PLD) [Cleaved into: Phospholipase D catalytic chain n=1 Tax=Durusdinium trenchii TaxID=1381693 RepID=A0ABP0KW56_9DINO